MDMFAPPIPKEHEGKGWINYDFPRMPETIMDYILEHIGSENYSLISGGVYPLFHNGKPYNEYKFSRYWLWVDGEVLKRSFGELNESPHTEFTKKVFDEIKHFTDALDVKELEAGV